MNTALNTPLLNTPLSPGMRELTLDEIDQVEGGLPIAIPIIIAAGSVLAGIAVGYYLNKKKG